MAKAEEKEKKEGAPEEQESGKSKKKLFILIGAGGLGLAVVAVAALFVLPGLFGGSGSIEHGSENGSAETAEHSQAEAHSGSNTPDAGGETSKHGASEKKAEEQPTGDAHKIDFGETYTFKPFNLNLGNPLENHYVRLEIAVEYLGGESQRAEIERRMPQLRDAVVNVTGRKSREFLLGPDGKNQLRLELLNRINQYMTKKVENVYITDIIIE